MNTLKLIGAGAACLFIGYCVLGPVVRGITKEDPPTAAPVAAMVPAPPPPAPPKAEASAAVAIFLDGDVLDECVDVTLTMPPGTEHSLVSERISKFVATMLENTGKGKETAELKKACSAQFPDRTALGVCRMDRRPSMKDEPEMTLHFVSQTYNVESLDTYMKDCLKDQGDWKSVDADTLNIERMNQRSKSTRKLIRALAEETP